MAKTEHPHKKNDLLDPVQKLVKDRRRKTPFNDDRPGESWYRDFLKRHPQIYVREPENITGCRLRSLQNKLNDLIMPNAIFLTMKAALYYGRPKACNKH